MFRTLINLLLLLALVLGVAAVINPDVRAKLVAIGQQVSQFVVQIINQIKEKAAASSPSGATNSGSGQNGSFLDTLLKVAVHLWSSLGLGS
jgi:hypothetical protein